jgi:capsular exopolysaccharide synthesis family protein
MERGEGRPAELTDYIAILKARKWTVLLVTLVVVGAVVAFSMSQTPLYTAGAKVLVEEPASVSLQPDFFPTNVQTQQEVAMSEPVARIALQDLGVAMNIDSLLAGLTVNAIVETEVLQIQYTSEDPELARNAADAFAESYLKFRRETAVQEYLVEENAIETRLDEASQELASLAADIEEARLAEDLALVTTLETQRNSLIARLGVLQQRLDDLQATRASRTAVGQVIEAAELPGVPSSPRHPINVALGVLVGLGFGIALAFVRERLDDRFRGRADVERVVGAPVMATVPRFRAARQEQGNLIAQHDPHSAATEAYRTLRTNLQFVTAQHGTKRFLVTSPSAREGKSVTTSNLAITLAQAGNRIILVSADLRRPTLEEYFGLGINDGAGLSTWLVSQTSDPRPALRNPGIPNLRIFSSGPVPPNPSELLTSGRMLELIHLLEQNADYVIVDSPPVLPVADASILASRIGSALLVVDAAKTPRTATSAAKQELERSGGTIVGVVLNSFDLGTSPYYESYASYTGAQSAKDGTPRPPEKRGVASDAG